MRQLVYGERGAGLATVLVDGKVVLEHGRLTQVDEASLLQDICRTVERLAPAFELAEASVADIHRVMRAVLDRCAREPVAADTHAARL